MADKVKFTSSVVGGRRVIGVAGELDASNSGRIYDLFVDALYTMESGDVLVVDMLEVTFCDSSSLHTLVTCGQIAMARSVRWHVLASDDVMAVLEASRISAFLVPVVPVRSDPQGWTGYLRERWWDAGKG